MTTIHSLNLMLTKPLLHSNTMLPLDGLDWSTSMATISLSVTLLVISASKTYLQQVKARAEESANRIKEKITLLDENTVQTYEGGCEFLLAWYNSITDGTD
mmetsp:Transcript_19065/g.32483  ORF Transcript_19065/g.32483 Transcript_19065/m.32483 type:complete len:101 (-) Transcript_19065:40-342(-)